MGGPLEQRRIDRHPPTQADAREDAQAHPDGEVTRGESHAVDCRAVPC